VAGRKEHVNLADRVGRAHHLELFGPPEIAEVDDAEFTESNHAADRLRIVGIAKIRFVGPRRKAGTRRVRASAAA